jgi:hypothetical protein
MVLFISNAKSCGTAEEVHACWCTARLGYFLNLKVLLEGRGRPQIAGFRACRKIDIKMIMCDIGTAIYLARVEGMVKIATTPLTSSCLDAQSSRSAEGAFNPWQAGKRRSHLPSGTEWSPECVHRPH